MSSFVFTPISAVKPILGIIVAIVMAWPLAPHVPEAQQTLPSPAFVLHIPAMRVAEMSPDDSELAALVVHWPRGSQPTAELQVWNPRQNTPLRTRSFPPPEPQLGRPRGAADLHYTSDGQFLAIYTGGDVVHVVRASDLEETRSVALQSHDAINAFETSPAAHRLAINSEGHLRIYDLDSGEATQTFHLDSAPPPAVWPFGKSHPRVDRASIAWREDGNALAISVADDSPCLRGGGTVYVFDVTANQIVKSFRVPLLPSSIAFGAGNRLYVASGTCGGYLEHWTLDLPIYDSTSGKEVGKVPAGKVGFRGAIAISASEKILLAHADREKTTFAGFEDTLEVKDEQWQVWDLATQKLLFLFPATAHAPIGGDPSLSRSGRFLYAYRERDMQIFSLPTAEK